MRVARLLPGERDTAAALADARALRRRIARALGSAPAEHLVLSPGILVGLEVLLRAVGARRLVLTDREYYDARHFPGRAVTVVPFGAPEQAAHAVRVARPDVLVASAVSWRGDALPVRRFFAAVRAAGARAPLLVLDGTHLGALGFPDVAAFGADVVCGDPGKWTASLEHENRLAYLWIRRRALLQALAPAYRPFFLALPAAAPAPQLLASRWVSPADVRALSRILDGATALRRRHARNMALRESLAHRFGVAAVPAPTAMLWLPEAVARREAPALTRLARDLPVWRVKGQGARVLCRAEFLTGRRPP